ncbi:hypothetical protein OG555_15300 [Kribbella sp. NBC_01484]|uniref:hypothetical protein n=1 Tax=Kribbella sp. NBC_01484 TaxID=2903579 RepID=UPI002E36B578|nr:hypothetical protein [Kribbella sp. NBC_01484]
MGQIDRFVERTLVPPRGLMRGWSLVMVAALVVRAVLHHRFENVLAAVLFTVVLLPAAIAPAVVDRIGRWERAHPVLDCFVALAVIGSSGFLLLRYFLDRRLSAAVALPVAAGLAVVGVVWRRSTPRPSSDQT